MRQFFRQFLSSFWSVPLALLATTVLAFGLLSPVLGFYYDDWHFVYYASRGTQGLIDIFNYDGHPMSVGFYIVAFKLLGFNPFLWHLFALFSRWLAIVAFWLCLGCVWPRHKGQVFTAALFFALYPLFTLQALPISYVEVWIGFFVLGLSFFFTFQAIRRPERFWLFTTLAILVKVGHVFTSEYSWGTELMRPFFVWFMLPQQLSWKAKLRQAITICLPYIVIFVAMISWRAFFYQGGRKAFQAQTGLLTNPLATFLSLPRYIIPDMGLIVFSSWYPVFNPKYLDLGTPINFAIMLLIILCSVIAFIYLKKIFAADNAVEQDTGWGLQALVVGFAGLVFGLIPAYGAGYSIYLTEVPINARLALGAVPGAALIVAALVEMLARNRAKLVLVAVLAGALIGWHVRYTNDFRTAWSDQVSFYRQLAWRVPGMKANTALVTEQGIFRPIAEFPASVAVEGDFPTALAINVIYGARPDADGRLPYWFFPSSDSPVNGEHVDIRFVADPKNYLPFTFSPEKGECLHILSAEDSVYRRLPQSLRTLAGTSVLTGIDPDARTDFGTLESILGGGATDTWCYFYEQADLARQKKDWATIVALWTEAGQKGFHPATGLEYLPFVEADARLGDWAQASELTRASVKQAPNMADLYCPLWGKLALETATSQAKDRAFRAVSGLLKCSAP